MKCYLRHYKCLLQLSDMMNESSTFKVCEIFNRTDEGMTTFEHFFYIGCGITGFIFNAIVMVIALLHVDTHDKPRQVNINISPTFSENCLCTSLLTSWPYFFPIFLSKHFLSNFWYFYIQRTKTFSWPWTILNIVFWIVLLLSVRAAI